ncbi:hypothetical protein [Rhizobium sp. 007]|uniref:hypothetical protein n=1 Tax=Rhizobium sp. 007 TaxID=2785056 RepID=UPI00188EF7F5|nr:hypothetical protein [Rhizobium sp. 007]QPB24572.1 hypothetical protein ISN39_34125 [Rhizobium sp. 007]
MARDTDAGVKLRGALLRLDALKPEGFTSQELATLASVTSETARDFLKADRASYTRTVQPKPSEKGRGRPSNLYVVTDEGRESLVEEIVQLRRQFAESPDELSADDCFRPIVELEETITDLEASVMRVADFEDLLIEAKESLKSCWRDMKALEARQSVYAVEFALRLGAAENRTETVTGRAGRTAHRKVAQQADVEQIDFVNWIVGKFGGWFDKQSGQFAPVLMLFDGIQGHDPISSQLVEFYQRNAVSIAAFDVARMEHEERSELYKAIAQLREVTPLAGSKLVLTMDGKTDLGQQLAEEFEALMRPTGGHDEIYLPDLGLMDLKRIRQSYLSRLAVAQQGEIEPNMKHFFSVCASALSAFDAVEETSDTIADMASLLGDDTRREKLLTAAHNLLGDVVCLDSNFNQSIKDHLDGAHVTYVANRLDFELFDSSGDLAV